jgi:hypothetical protein
MVKSSLGLIKHHAMKTYGGSGGIAVEFLISALEEDKWSASCHCRFTPGETVVDTYCIGGLMGPRVGVETL